MKIVAFGASNSKNSINKQFATYVAHQFNGDEQILDLNDFPLPIYTIDLEKESGIPANANQFMDVLKSVDLLIISLAEHNGSYTAVFKNLVDWLSRIENKFLTDKKLFLLSTSPGGRGGLGVMAAALDRFPRHGAKVVGTFSLPSFQNNFNANEGISEPELKEKLEAEIKKVTSVL